MVSGSYRQWEDGTAPLPRLDLPHIDVDGDAKLPGQVIDERAPRMTGPLPKLELQDYHAQEQWRDGSAPLPRVKRRRPRADDGKGEGSGKPANPGKPEAKPGKSAKSKAEKPVHREARPRAGAEEAPETPAPEPRNWPRTIGRGLRHLAGVVAFALIGLMLLGLVDRILSPYQSTSIMTDKSLSFHDEPRNTIEVLLLGPSTTADGFIPTQLWEEQGICAYNLGTSAQPMLASVSLAKEAYKLHSETLKTLVIDPSVLRYDPENGMYRLALDEVSLASKYDEVMAWKDSGDDKMVYLSSLYAYHNRWSELTSNDAKKLLWPTHPYLRGYEVAWDRMATEAPSGDFVFPEQAPDPSAEPSSLAEEELSYFDELVEFCKERNIDVVLVKTPLYDHWSSSDHNAMSQIAEQYGIPFLDLNYEPFFTSTGYNRSLDTRDGYHPNDSGASKITRYLGDYLLQNGLARDVRDDERYAFMDGQLPSFHAVTTDLAELRGIVDFVDYLKYVTAHPNYVVYVGVDGEGAGMITSEQRMRLEELGFHELSHIEAGDSYWAKFGSGRVLEEELSTHRDRTLYMNYSENDYIAPIYPYYCMLDSTDPEAIAGWMYREDSENNPFPTWRPVYEGVSMIVYDTNLDMVIDDPLFRADSQLQRYADPQALLDAYLASGMEEGDLPWYLWNLKQYNDEYARVLDDFRAELDATEGQ